jgi:transcriptional regulator with XRE-family HTH domain
MQVIVDKNDGVCRIFMKGGRMAEMSAEKRALLDTFGERVKTIRLERKWTQQELADLMQAPRTWVSDLENAGQRGIAAETVVRFAKALEVSTDYLLGLTDDQAPRQARARARLTPGLWKGQVWIAPDFDDTDEELIRLFEGEDDDVAS